MVLSPNNSNSFSAQYSVRLQIRFRAINEEIADQQEETREDHIPLEIQVIVPENNLAT